MNRLQKFIVLKFVTVIVITAAAVFAMINFKDWVNRSEAMRAMEYLGVISLEYREKNRALPSESYVNNNKERLPGYARLGKIHYRALWIESDAKPDEILAYIEKKYRSLILKRGFIVLRLDGSIEWMAPEKFETLLAQQQTPMETEISQQ